MIFVRMSSMDNEHPGGAAGWRWDHSYTRLPEIFFSRTLPVPVRSPSLVVFNQPLAVSLGLDSEWLAVRGNAGLFTGNIIPPGADPIAQAYAGHQFGHFTGLGDGRAILLGGHLAPDGGLFDIQLKGSGRTPYSRGGDGRAALGPMLREYIISEAIHALGIPTTRSLAVAVTGEDVQRTETLPGAILTRVAASHIRVGTFQWAAAHEDLPALEALADYTRERHFPGISHGESRHIAFFEAVMDRQAALIARWLHAGFIHGVMNTDNMALSGETIDYGPCAFMDAYDPDKVFSSIDRGGRYAYGKQAAIARWNLARLAEAMLPLLHPDQKSAVDLANDALARFEPGFRSYWLAGMRAKLGLVGEEDDDASLVQELLDAMVTHQMDFTNTFRSLSDESAIIDCPFAEAELVHWHGRWKERLERFAAAPVETSLRMRQLNPAVIPRNHIVEKALADATDHDDLDGVRRLLAILAMPFQSGHPEEYLRPAPEGSPPYQTFCGT
jgi:uncharacterized protein YdiU (UPF0061 family)